LSTITKAAYDITPCPPYRLKFRFVFLPTPFWGQETHALRVNTRVIDLQSKPQKAEFSDEPNRPRRR